MSWQTKIVTYVRGITNDFGPTATNSDEKLEQLIVIAAMMVTEEVSFSATYLMDVEEISITPDPSLDVPFINLVSMKVACMLARADQKNRARQAYSIKDGPSNIDGRTPAEQTTKWADTICKDYSEALIQYKLGDLQPGKAILSPYNWNNDSSAIGGLPTRFTSSDYFN